MLSIFSLLNSLLGLILVCKQDDCLCSQQVTVVGIALWEDTLTLRGDTDVLCMAAGVE